MLKSKVSLKSLVHKSPFRRCLGIFIKRFLRKFSNKLVLDVGAGSSPYFSLVCNRVSLVINPRCCPDVLGTIYHLPFRSEGVPVFLTTKVLELLVHSALALSEILCVLKKNGFLILSTRLIHSLHGLLDYYRCTKEALLMLLRNEKFTPIYIAEDGGLLLLIAHSLLVRFSCILPTWYTTFFFLHSRKTRLNNALT